MKLLDEINNIVIPTNLTRKLTINGVTKAYPIYKININSLYYNDQNDRIASWISQYKEENGPESLTPESLTSLSKDEYNGIIEKFIVSSNPQSIEKTAMNIKLIGQREAGVVLNDGRVIDGNRRFTCIRKLNQTSPELCWFEAVILDMDINDNKKMIKMLELTIQHGEEKRVDYNHVEMLIGIYQDIVETELLSIEEYAQSTNESIVEIKRKVAASKILAEYLEYIGMPKQYYIAREYQLVSLISDVQDLLKKCVSSEMVDKLKRIIYCNQMMNAIGDERKFTKNIATMIANGQYPAYEASQLKIEEKILKRKEMSNIETFVDYKAFVSENDDLAVELKESMDYYLNHAKIVEVHNKPSQTISKTLVSLKDIDTNIISKLTPVEKDKLVNQLSHLSTVINEISVAADGPIIGEKTKDDVKEVVVPDVKPIKIKPIYTIIPSLYNEMVFIENFNKSINGLIFSLKMKLSDLNEDNNYSMFFLNEDNEIISETSDVELSTEYQSVSFELNPKASQYQTVNLAIKKKSDKDKELRFLYKMKLDISFEMDFDF